MISLTQPWNTWTRVSLVAAVVGLMAVGIQSVSAQGRAQIVPEAGVIPGLNKAKSSRGSTGHITVYGDDLRRNKAVSSWGDDVVRKLAKFLGEPEPKKSVYPINLILYSKGNAKRGVNYTTSVVPIEQRGYTIRLIIDVREGVDQNIIKQGMMQALLLERTMRTNPEINKNTKVTIPYWLSDGLLGAVQWKEAPTSKAVYRLLKQRPDLYPVKLLLATKEKQYRALGKTRRDIYHASATALVLSLQRQKGGKESLAKLLSEIAVFEGEPEELFRKHFPTMNVGSKGLQKLWNLQLADMASSRMLDTRSIRETEKRLSEILFFTLRAKGGVAKMIPLEHYDVLVGLVPEERIQVINALRQRIQQLSYRSYPDFQPLLAEYGFILTDIARGNTETVALRLKNLVEERKRILAAGDRVRNVLDWYQLNDAKDLKGDFSGYEKLIKQIEAEKQKNADSVITPYVEQMEQLMKR